MRDELRHVLVPYRAQAILLSLIAACALPIAAIGLLGAVTQSVRLRNREMAIRAAIGADEQSLRRVIVRPVLAVLTFGILLGTALGAVAGSLISHQLLNVRPADGLTITAVTSSLLVLGWLTATLSARWSLRVQPSTALRSI